MLKMDASPVRPWMISERVDQGQRVCALRDTTMQGVESVVNVSLLV